MTTRNDAKVREITCEYAKGVDDINAPQPPSGGTRTRAAEFSGAAGRAPKGPSGLPISDLAVCDGHVAMVVGNGMMA
ncbi:MAG TPA: hypothetical protein VE197_05220 [Mycobacterium sp.]|nr:hypothetical protein [Mycobacterium sp.]